MAIATSKTHACPLCGALGFRPSRFGLLQCESCGVIVSPLIWQPRANEAMEEAWFGEEYQPNVSCWVRWFERANNRRTLRRLADARLKGERLLEIGVGSGSFLVVAQRAGFDVMGCDLSKAIAQRVHLQYRLRIHLGPVESLEGEGRFDVIVMNHVLEHTQDPIGFLRQACRLLRPGGLVHIAVPNVTCWEARFSGWNSYEPYHLLYFSQDTLLTTVQAAGFEVRQMASHESFSGWFLALMRSLLGVGREGAVERSQKSGGGKVVDQRPGWLEYGYRLASVMAGVVMLPLRWLQAKLMRGDELIVIAGRRGFHS